jgi:hypothetical protein
MKTIRNLLLGALMLVVAGHAFAFRYVRYDLLELVACADIVVIGTIRSIEKEVSTVKPGELAPAWERNFSLEIDELVVGEKLPERIQVRCFEDWACASRWTSYAPGQRVLLFLAKPKESSLVHTILGAGGEGEMPLLGKSVCVRHYDITGYDSRTSDIDGTRVVGPLVAIEEFARAIQRFRVTYTCEMGKRPRIDSIQPKQGVAAAEAYAATSKTARYFHEQALSSKAWRGARRPRRRTRRESPRRQRIRGRSAKRGSS